MTEIAPLAPPAARAAAPPAWAALLVVSAPLLAWHEALVRALAEAPRVPTALSPALAPWLGVGVIAAGVLAETAGYGILWAACGRRLRLGWAALAVLQLSVLELLAGALLAATTAHAGAAWRVALLGQRAALGGAGHGGFAIAFGGAGLLAALRVALAGCVQADCAGAPRRAGLALVSCAWLVSHLVQAGVVDLVWGRSVGR